MTGTPSPSPLRLRPYTEADAEATLDVFLRAITITAAAHYSSAQITAWSRPEERSTPEWNSARAATHTLVAVCAARVVGLADVDATGYIDMMFVDPSVGRRGVGSLLVDALRARALDGGVSELWTNASIAARPFFEHHGFVVAAEQHPVVGGVSLTNYRMVAGINR
jgi:putative acetyltransferase